MLKILFADDSMTAQNMGKKILTDAGYDVVAVSNGAAAAKKLLEQQPDVAILDVHMPGYSGFEVCAKIRAVPATAKMPVLLTVGKMEPYSVEEGAKVKADGVIIKPFEASVLLATVRNLAERAQAVRADREDFEATMRIEPPKFEEFKDDSYTAWKSETDDSKGAAEPAAKPKQVFSEPAATAPAYAFDATMPAHSPQEPAFDETIPFRPPLQPAAEFPPAAQKPQTSVSSATPAYAFEETIASPPPPQPSVEFPPVASSALDETVPAWPGEQQAAVQAAARAAFVTQPRPAAPVAEVAEYIETAKIEPVVPASQNADIEEILRDTQKIAPWKPSPDPVAMLETFELSTPAIHIEPPAGFEPTVLAPTADPVVARDPSFESPLYEVGVPDVQAGSEPGLLGNAIDASAAPGFATAAFPQPPSLEELSAQAELATPVFSRPQDIAFDKMVSDLLEREPVPLVPSSLEPNTIPASSIPIPEQPEGFFSKYLARGLRGDEEQSGSAVPTVELNHDFGVQTPVPLESLEYEPLPALASAPVELHAAKAVESAVGESDTPHPSLETQSAGQIISAESGIDIASQSAHVSDIPEEVSAIGVSEETRNLESSYAPTMEYSFPEGPLRSDQESVVESVLASVPEPVSAGPPAIADSELAAELAAALEQIEPTPAPEPIAATAIHERAPSPASGGLDMDMVSLIITRVLDRMVPEMVRMIANEIEAERSHRLH